MKRLLFIISIALVGCSKENICLHCEKAGEADVYICEDEVPNISVVAYNATNDGWLCEQYSD